MSIRIESKEGLSPRVRLGVEILETSNLLKEYSVTFFKQFDLTPQQYNILAILHHGGAMSTSDILEWMYEKNAGVSRLVDRLIKKGLLVKDVNPKDKRTILVKLTEDGLRLYKKADSAAKEAVDATKNLTDSETQQLIDLLIKMRG